MPQLDLDRALAELEALLHRQRREELFDYLEGLDHYERLRLLNALDPPRLQRLLAAVGRQHLADLLAELDPEDAAALLERLEVPQAADLAERMEPDDAADVVGELDAREAEQVLTEMVPEESAKVRALLRYPPETAGGLMTPEFASIRADWTVGETLRTLRARAAEEAETIYYLYVTDREGRLCGVVSLRDLVLADEGTPIEEILNEDVVSVSVDTDQEEVARRIRQEDLLALPVVDHDRRLVGIVTVDDVLDVLEEEYSEDILKFSSIEGGEERCLSPPLLSVRRRWPWMAANLVMAFLAVGVVASFEGTLQQVVILAAFMPVISGMGGNVGIQALSVALRGLAVGEVTFQDFWRVLHKELAVGFLNGLLLGVQLGLIAYLWRGNFALGGVATLALWCNTLLASVLGGTLPFLLKRLGLDPAMMTGAILTTITDVIGFFIFLGLGTLFLSYL